MKYILLLIYGILPVCIGFSSVHTEITIPAEPEIVWSVLADADGYKEWNPVVVPIEGSLREGEKIRYQMTQPDGKQSEVMARVKKMVSLHELNQGGGIPGILTIDHRWLLEPVDGGTRVIQHEEYRGIGVWFWDESWVEPAYTWANEALRKWVLQLQEMKQSGDGSRE